MTRDEAVYGWVCTAPPCCTYLPDGDVFPLVARPPLPPRGRPVRVDGQRPLRAPRRAAPGGAVSPAKVAQRLQVVREGSTPARLYIDGVLFPYATVDGFSVHPHRGKMPGVTVTIAAWRV